MVGTQVIKWKSVSQSWQCRAGLIYLTICFLFFLRGKNIFWVFFSCIFLKIFIFFISTIEMITASYILVSQGTPNSNCETHVYNKEPSLNVPRLT